MTTWTTPLTLHRENMPETTMDSHAPLLNQHLTIQLNLMDITWAIIQAPFWEPTKPSMAWWLGFTATGTNRNITKSPTCRPVSLAALAEVPRLVNIIVVEVTKFGLHALASRARYDLVRPLVRRRIFFIFIFFSLSCMQRNCRAKKLDTLFLGGHEREREREKCCVVKDWRVDREGKDIALYIYTRIEKVQENCIVEIFMWQSRQEQDRWRGKADDELFVHIITPRHLLLGLKKSSCGSRYR